MGKSCSAVGKTGSVRCFCFKAHLNHNWFNPDVGANECNFKAVRPYFKQNRNYILDKLDYDVYNERKNAQMIWKTL